MKPAYQITIRRRKSARPGRTATRWVVSKPACLLPQAQARKRTGPAFGEVVEWRVASPGVVAYLQFTDMHLFENVAGSRRLTKDKNAVVTHGNPLQLRVRGYKKGHEHRRRHYYAVWVEEEIDAAALAGKGRATAAILAKRALAGGGFAVGHTLNPPPEINLGP